MSIIDIDELHDHTAPRIDEKAHPLNKLYQSLCRDSVPDELCLEGRLLAIMSIVYYWYYEHDVVTINDIIYEINSLWNANAGYLSYIICGDADCMANGCTKCIPLCRLFDSIGLAYSSQIEQAMADTLLFVSERMQAKDHGTQRFTVSQNSFVKAETRDRNNVQLMAA